MTVFSQFFIIILVTFRRRIVKRICDFAEGTTDKLSLQAASSMTAKSMKEALFYDIRIIPAEVLERLRAQVKENITLFRAAFAKSSEPLHVRPISEGTISLITTLDDCFFVRWTNASTRKARRITVDERHGIVTIVAYKIIEESFVDSTLETKAHTHTLKQIEQHTCISPPLLMQLLIELV